MVRVGSSAAIPQIRDRLRAINPQGVILITPMDDLVAIHQTPWKANFAPFSVFAWLTVLLAIVGSLRTARVHRRRTRARDRRNPSRARAGTRRIVGLVLGDGVRVALCGIAAGMLTAFAGGGLCAPLLVRHLSPFDGFALAAAPIALITVAIAALLIPAFRAARVDPAITLRAE